MHTIAVEGELDLATARELEQEVEAAEQGDARQIVLDLTDLTFIDSTGVALLVQAMKRSQQNADRLRFRRCDSVGVRRVLEMTGIEDRLPYLD
jgi:anti-sigma B factor antagonist